MAIVPKLTPDELGAKGEGLFKSLCADAKLICNKSERDRTGWDFLVEFPFPVGNNTAPLDERSIPISCHIQQKTVWSWTNRIKVRLSSAERLAKELKPSFIYVLLINQDLLPTGACLIHLIDGPLGLVLKRLRLEEQKHNSKINSLYITFEPSKIGQGLLLTGLALREAIIEACGVNLGEYMIRKNDQLAKLGFGQGRYKTEMTIEAGSERDLVDAFLGLRSDVPITNIKSFEDRFGIILPTEPTSLTGGKLTLRPSPAFNCTITYREHPGACALAFDGEVFFPLRFITEEGKVTALIRSEFFDIRYGDRSFEFSGKDGIFDSYKSKIKDWHKYLELCVSLGTGLGEFEIQLAIASPPLKLPLNGKEVDGIDQDFCRYFIETLTDLTIILDLTGYDDIGKVPFSDIGKNSRLVRLVRHLSNKINTTRGFLSFSTDAPDRATPIANAYTLAFIVFLEIGIARIGFAAKAEMVAIDKSESIDWLSIKVSSHSMRRLTDLSDAVQRFANEMQAEIGATGTIIQTLGPDSK